MAGAPTATAGWSPSDDLSPGADGQMYELHIAQADDGTAIAIWLQRGSLGIYDLFWNIYTPGTGWANASLLETSDAGEVWHPFIAMDPAGNGMALWSQPDGVARSIFARYYRAGSGWENVTPVETSSAGAGLPRLVMDPSGNASASWTQSFSGGFGLLWSRFVPGVGWSAAEPVQSVPTLEGFEADLAVAEDGTVTAVWAKGPPPYDIFANHYSPGMGWGTQISIESHPGTAQQRTLGSNDRGDALAVWRSQDNGTSVMILNYYTAGLGWSGPTVLTMEPQGPQTRPQAFVDAAGNAMAAWTANYGGNTRVLFAARPVGSAWTTPATLDNDGMGDAREGQLRGSPDGRALAVWRQGGEQWARRYIPGVGWGMSTPLDGSNNTLHEPIALASDRTGNGSAAWFGWAPEGGFNVRASRYTAAADEIPPALTINTPAQNDTLLEPSVLVTGVTEPGATLVANGVVAYVESNGSFSVRVALTAGVNHIDVRAWDATGNMARQGVNVTYIDPAVGLQAALDAVRARLDAAEAELQRTTTTLEETQVSLVATRASLAALQGSLNATRAELAEARASANSTGADLEVVSALLNATADDLASAMLRIGAMEAEAARLRASLNQTAAALSSTEEDLRSTTQRLNETEENLATTEGELRQTAAVAATAQALGLAGLLVAAGALAFAFYLSRRRAPPPSG